MDGPILADDVVVSRVNGTLDVYVIGTVVSGTAGYLRLHDVSAIDGLDKAIKQGYTRRSGEHRVWLFDGSAAGYVHATDPGVA
jgi:hypothetical protein